MASDNKPAGDFQCGICESVEVRAVVRAREMMLGRRTWWRYRECAACGCLQLGEIPEDLASYYGKDYPVHRSKPASSLLKRFALRSRARYVMTGSGLLGKLLCALKGPPMFDQEILKAHGIGLDDAVLEIGCGSGDGLRQLSVLGFTNLTGQDLFSKPEDSDGIRFVSEPISAIEGQFRLVLGHHVIEHMPQARETFQMIRRLMAPGGIFMMEIPMVESLAYELYGADWAGLDAPRHLYLHTRRSVAALAAQSGMRIETLTERGGTFGFAMSEQYRRDIPAIDERSSWYRRDLFTEEEWNKFEELSRRACAEGRSDAARFVLARAD